jgi:hypothetical protein
MLYIFVKKLAKPIRGSPESCIDRKYSCYIKNKKNWRPNFFCGERGFDKKEKREN